MHPGQKKIVNTLRSVIDEHDNLQAKADLFDELVKTLGNTKGCIENLSVDLGDDFEEKWEWQKANVLLTKARELK